MHKTVLSGDETTVLLFGFVFALACVFIVLFFLSSKRHVSELEVRPKYEFRSAYVSGNPYLRFRVPFPTMRVAIYDTFMVLSTLRQLKVPYSEVTGMLVFGGVGVELKFKTLKSRMSFFVLNEDARNFLMKKIK